MTPEHMTRGATSTCTFRTKRLIVGEWHALATLYELDLPRLIARLLTKKTTATLPVEWSGSFDIERSGKWIETRDAESPTLLAIEHETSQPVGLLILFEVDDPNPSNPVEVRLGYVLGEWASGLGFATELVGGFVDWAVSQSTISLLSGGVVNGHASSMRVMRKNGFSPSETQGREQIYERRLRRSAKLLDKK